MGIALSLTAVFAFLLGIVFGLASKSMTAPASTSFVIFGPIFSIVIGLVVGLIWLTLFAAEPSVLFFGGLVGFVSGTGALYLARAYRS